MSIFGSLKSKITQYAESYIELFKLNLIGKTASLLSYFMFAMICMFVAFGIIILLGFGLTEVFIAVGLSKVAAIFITIGIYILLLLVLLGLRKNITNYFAGTFIKVMTEGEDENEKN